MLHLRILGPVLAAAILLLPLSVVAEPPAATPDPVRIAQSQSTTIGLMASGPGSTDARIAAEIAQAVDEGDKLRVLPIMGRGSEQNIADLIYLKGVDVAIVHADALKLTMQAGTIPKENAIQYITQLFQEEVHVLVRNDIISLSDLTGKPVAIGAPGSGTEITAAALLDALQINATVTHDVQSIALDRLRHGEIAAMFVIGGEPVPVIQAISTGEGLHLVAIPLNAKLIDSYVPASLDQRSYPNLVPGGQPVDTVAVGSLLVTLATPADSARAKRVNRFVDTLFERFDRFSQPGFHPKWQEVNLSAQVPGWTRYPEAANHLRKVEPSLRAAAQARSASNDHRGARANDPGGNPFIGYENQSSRSTALMSKAGGTVPRPPALEQSTQPLQPLRPCPAPADRPAAFSGLPRSVSAPRSRAGRARFRGSVCR